MSSLLQPYKLFLIFFSCIRLDPVLQKVCKDDAKAVCHAKSLDDSDSYPSSLVIACLYRNSVLETQTQVSAKSM